MSNKSLKEINLKLEGLVALKRLSSLVKTACSNFNIRENKLKIDSFNISCRVNRALNVDNVVTFKATNNVTDIVNLTNI